MSPTTLPSGWTAMVDTFGAAHWDRFEAAFGFRASVHPEGWPAIREPEVSITLGLGPIFEKSSAEWAAGRRALNAVALLAMVEVFPPEESLVVLDRQHPGYHLQPRVFAEADEPWPGPEPVPDGDYYAFLNESMTEGTFGHPWEQTLCVIGPRMVAALGDRLAAWLPVVRRGGIAV